MLRTLSLAATLALATLASACSSPPMCGPDSGPPCECNPGDNKMCTDSAGAQGLQVCSMQGQWGDCAPFADDVVNENQPGDDAMIFDTNYNYE